ncbi:MAG: hypothetical protein ABIZ81_17580 [Opitutaceae bacterium]
MTDSISPEFEIESRIFANRLEAGQYLNELVTAAGISQPEKNRGLWAWLTLFYFDQVCPADPSGARSPKEEARLVAQVDNFQRFYRHLLLGPFLIVRTHLDQPERANAFLCNPLHQPGEIAEQLASRKELVTNRAVVELTTKLYYDPAQKTFRRGATNKVRGAARRLSALLNQLDLTWYLYGMTAEEIAALLPKEFDRFRTPA